MGAAVIFVFLMATTVFANITIASRVSAYYRATYLPKSPRRPIILVWPSVMNPAVAAGVRQKIWEEEQIREEGRQYADRYLRLECSKEMHVLMKPIQQHEVRVELLSDDKYHLNSRAEKFFKKLFHQLVQWLSGQAIECGFYTIFPNEREQIYHLINANRNLWITALRELANILLQVIAVIHNKTGVFANGPKYGNLDWLGNWPSAYEKWYQNYDAKDGHDSPLDYLQTVILDAFDIVTAWLFDYLAERTRDSSPSSPTWTHSTDAAIVCALEKYDREDYGPVEDSKRWDNVLKGVKEESKMKSMAEAFMTCEIKKGCTYRYPITLMLGTIGRSKFVVIPRPEDCTHTCTKVSEKHKNIVLRLAHMTTRAGYDLYCSTPKIGPDNVTLQCHPLIVEKYITARQNKICKSDKCKRDCCKKTPPSAQPHCEMVTNANDIRIRNVKNVKNVKQTRVVKLQETMTTFAEFL